MNDRQFVEALDLCYSVLDGQENFGHLGHYLCDVVGADACDIVREAKRGDSIRTYFSTGFDPAFLESYDTEFLGENPWFENLLVKPRDRFHTRDAEPEGFREGAYFNEWVKPQGFDDTLGAVLEDGPDYHAWIGFVRDAKREGFQESDTVNRLLPHLRRVLSTRVKLDEEDPTGAGLHATFDALTTPALIIGPEGHVRECNRAAAKLLAGGSVLKLARGNVLQFTEGQADRQLKAMLSAIAKMADDPGQMNLAPVLLGHEEQRFVATLLPLRGQSNNTASVLFVTPYSSAGPLSVEGVRAAYGLTPTEAELAVWLAQGKELKMFAETRGMSLGTARWHLKNLENKTETRRAEELVALVRAVQIPVETP